MTDLERKAVAILSRIAKRDAAELKPGQDLVADLGIDSPKALEMICDLEEECGIEVPDDAVGTLETVGDVLKIVRDAESAATA